MPEVYCSSGAFVGRINDRNAHLIAQYGPDICCDGIEFMLFSCFYEQLPALIRELQESGLRFPVLHADKSIGDRISAGWNAPDRFDIWKTNCETACAIGAKKMVTHIWGIPDSDAEPEEIYETVCQLQEVAAGYGIHMLAENCCCKHQSPLLHFRNLHRICPQLHYIIDTRPAQFHGELQALMDESWLWNGMVEHIHISDYRGAQRDWNALYPILPPGAGDVDFSSFWTHLQKIGYNGSLTLESPCMRPDGVDTETLSHYLAVIYKGLSIPQPERCGRR